jgi:hypothetical protein
MTEDSGAFKTNPANSRRVPAFVMDPAGTVAMKPHRFGKRAAACWRGICSDNFYQTPRKRCAILESA